MRAPSPSFASTSNNHDLVSSKCDGKLPPACDVPSRALTNPLPLLCLLLGTSSATRHPPVFSYFCPKLIDSDCFFFFPRSTVRWKPSPLLMVLVLLVLLHA